MNKVQRLSKQEPWRRGLGKPATMLDPTWEQQPPLCNGHVEWDATGLWVCQTCGYIGSAATQMHQPAQGPLSFLLDSINFFLRKKAATVASESLTGQMLFIAGTALRYAAVHPELDDYVRKLVR